MNNARNHASPGHPVPVYRHRRTYLVNLLRGVHVADVAIVEERERERERES
jgi:hypothetical protein